MWLRLRETCGLNDEMWIYGDDTAFAKHEMPTSFSGCLLTTMLLTNRGTPQNSSAVRQIKTRTNLYSVYLYEILCVITIVIFDHVLSLFLFNVLLIDDVPIAIINPCLIAFRLNQERMMKPSMPGFQWVLLCFNADFQ